MAEDSHTPETGKTEIDKNERTSPIEKFPVKTAQETFELLTKIFVVAAAVLYITGFIIVSLHLARYGVHSFSIIRAQYILAGAWFYAHILVFVLIVIAIKHLFHLHREKQKKPNSIKSDKNNFAGIGKEGFNRLMATSFYIIFVLFYFGISVFTLDKMHYAVLYFIVVYLLLVTGVDLWNTYSTYRKNAIEIYGKLLILTIMLLLIIDGFSRLVYSNIPAEYGGGMPVKVQFHWKDEYKTKEVAAAFKKECKLAEEPVFFNQILATDTDHVIISPCPKEYPRTFEISNDLIDWVEIQY